MFKEDIARSRLVVKIKNFRRRVEMKTEAKTEYEKHERLILECMAWEYYDCGITDSDDCYAMVEELQKIQNIIDA